MYSNEAGSVAGLGRWWRIAWQEGGEQVEGDNRMTFDVSSAESSSSPQDRVQRSWAFSAPPPPPPPPLPFPGSLLGLAEA